MKPGELVAPCVWQHPSRPRAVLSDRDVSVELPRARERLPPRARSRLGGVRVPSCGEGAQKFEILIVQKSVLVEIESRRDRVRVGEGIREELVGQLHIVRGPAAI